MYPMYCKRKSESEGSRMANSVDDLNDCSELEYRSV